MAAVTALWRHPLKSHGRETLQQVTLTKGQTMPWDRHWAVTHEATKFQIDAPAWEKCRNFMIGSQNPGVAGIWSHLDEASGTLTLRHPDIGEIKFQPDTAEGEAAFLAWAAPIYEADKRTATAIVSNPARGMTDTPEATISIMTQASHKAIEDYFGHPVSPERWRGNIWLDGSAAWEEQDWIGKHIRIGNTVLAVTAPVVRCMATTANPATGRRDLATLAALRDGWDHQNFGIYAEVITSGDIAIGDTYEVL
jgi:uncharacterized protein YcbX